MELWESLTTPAIVWVIITPTRVQMCVDEPWHQSENYWEPPRIEFIMLLHYLNRLSISFSLWGRFGMFYAQNRTSCSNAMVMSVWDSPLLHSELAAFILIALLTSVNWAAINKSLGLQVNFIVFIFNGLLCIQSLPHKINAQAFGGFFLQARVPWIITELLNLSNKISVI